MPPRFRVTTDPDAATDERTVVLTPSRAFGDGRHESTRMCLQALAAFAPRAPFRLLDVGSGSGVLAIGAAKLGAEAVGVEIDAAANDAARANARRNGVEGRTTFGEAWPPGKFEVVIANILRDTLLELAPLVTARLAPGGLLVLSGIVSTDVPAIIARYAPALGARRPELFERGPWRAAVWRHASKSGPE